MVYYKLSLHPTPHNPTIFSMSPILTSRGMYEALGTTYML